MLRCPYLSDHWHWLNQTTCLHHRLGITHTSKWIKTPRVLASLTSMSFKALRGKITDITDIMHTYRDQLTTITPAHTGPKVVALWMGLKAVQCFTARPDLSVSRESELLFPQGLCLSIPYVCFLFLSLQQSIYSTIDINSILFTTVTDRKWLALWSVCGRLSLCLLVELIYHSGGRGDGFWWNASLRSSATTPSVEWRLMNGLGVVGSSVCVCVCRGIV